MAEILSSFADARGDEVALADERGVTTWRQLDERVDRLVHALRAAGLAPGATVALLMGNRREFFEVLAATAHAGMLAVPINWHWAPDEIAYVLDDCAAPLLVVGDRFVDLAGEALALAASPPALTLVAGDPPPGASYGSYEAALDEAPAGEPSDQREGGVMFYTSGTTGRPKGVRRALPAQTGMERARMMGFGFAMTMGVPAGGRTLLCGPLYHSAQWAFSYLPLCSGSTVVMRHKFDPAEVLELIDRERITNVHLVPTQMVRMLRLPDEVRAAFDGSTLAIAMHGAAPCPHDVKRRMIEWWGPKLVEYYGGTEGAVISLLSSEEWRERPGSVGRPLAMVEVAIADEEGRRLPIGETGHIYLRNTMAADFEYHGEPAKTRDAHLEPGMFTMGDLGRLDADGYLYLSDRRTDLILSGGVNIYPAEIERVLHEHPAVRDVAVVGIPDEEFGERVLAIVEVEPARLGDPTFEDELARHCRERLAGYKVPRLFELRDALPRTESGKLSRRALRDPWWPAAPKADG